MTLSDLIQRARQGEPQAIARLITDSLVEAGVVARSDWQGDHLHVTLESDQALDRQATISIIRRGFLRLDPIRPMAAVHIYSCRVGQTFPDWSDEFMLSSPASPPEAGVDPATTSFVLPPETTGNVEGVSRTVIAEPTYVSDRALVVLAHLAPLFGYLVGASNLLIGVALFWGAPFLVPWRIVAPLALLLTKGNDSRFVKIQTKEALNFQISMVIYWVITIVLCFILIGFLIAVPLAFLEVISIIVAAVQASEGKSFRYPLTIRFIR